MRVASETYIGMEGLVGSRLLGDPAKAGDREVLVGNTIKSSGTSAAAVR